MPIKLRPARSTNPRALSPLTSSQTRTHLTHTMHKFISISQNGSLVSKGIFLYLYGREVSKSISIYRTVSFNSHRSFLGHVTHLSVTDTCRKQMSEEPHKSTR